MAYDMGDLDRVFDVIKSNPYKEKNLKSQLTSRNTPIFEAIFKCNEYYLIKNSPIQVNNNQTE
jgi:hypothetical protein